VANATPLLITQNLTQDGFHSISSTKEMNYQQCAAALCALATFHAASTVLDRTDPKLKRGSYLLTAFPFLVPEQGMFKQTEMIFDEGMKIIGQLGPHIDPQQLLPGRDVAKVVSFMHRNLHTLLVNILKPHPTQLNTLCHTNCTNGSNFFFLQDPKNRGTICKLIGLSQVRYCRPAVDLALILFCAANQDVRSTKVDILLEVYREQFNKTLELCQKKHHSALPYSSGLLSVAQLQESVSQTKLIGVALRAMIVAREAIDTNTPEPGSQKQLLKEFVRNERFKKNITEAVKNLLEATEPYAGDCWLLTKHKNCPHHPQAAKTKEINILK
jgi:hypothetical protein